MPITTGPQISLNEIHLEVGGTSGSTATINDSDIRALIGKGNEANMQFSEWYGASSATTEQPSNWSSAVVTLGGGSTATSNSSIALAVGYVGIQDKNDQHNSDSDGWVFGKPSGNYHTYRDYTWLQSTWGTDYSGLPVSFNRGNTPKPAIYFAKFGLNPSYYTTVSSTNSRTGWLHAFGSFLGNQSTKASLTLPTGTYWLCYFITMNKNSGTTNTTTAPTFSVNDGTTTLTPTFASSNNGYNSNISGGSSIVSVASSSVWTVTSNSTGKAGAITAIPIQAV
jgi:hypothetical protein